MHATSEPPPITALMKMEEARGQARDLATKVAPLLRPFRAELPRNPTAQPTRTASYVLAQTAAGFLTEELMNREIAATLLHEIADAIAHDLLEGQRF